jgi:hypothetical protein
MGHWVAKKNVMRDVEDCLGYWADYDPFFEPHLDGKLYVTVTEQGIGMHL